MDNYKDGLWEKALIKLSRMMWVAVISKVIIVWGKLKGCGGVIFWNSSGGGGGGT
jgi:hypothetical protein